MSAVLKQHPLSAAFPAMPADELAALTEDIRANGLREAGVIFEAKILDGWHRYQACEQAGVLFKSFPLPAGRDPRALVKSRNLHRRHLTASQRASAVVACSEWAPVGRPINGAIIVQLSAAKLAEEADVSITTIKSAKAAHKAGLSEAVTSGKVTVDRAAEIAKLPKVKQEKALAEPKKKAKPVKADDWKAKYDTLAADYDELKENRDDLADELKTCEAIRGDTIALEMKQLREHLKICTRRRDELMSNAVEMRKECTRWQARAKKAGWKPGK